MRMGQDEVGEQCTNRVMRLKTSFTMMSMPWFLAMPIWGAMRGRTSRESLAVEHTEIDADDRHEEGGQAEKSERRAK